MNFKIHVDLKDVDCIWKGGRYSFTIEVPRDYPFTAPKCLCITPIYHPNIDLQGHVCLNILRDDWKPVLSINTVILGLIFLFYEPNSNDPLNHEAAEVMRKDQQNFKAIVKRTLKGGNFENIQYPKFI
uniref:UBC core domain-containing protein n=1 Tax=Strombidium rassoulzadegani TaxID=1082188 RepID=A0A7S3FXM7_9SPIT|mmetsp:Transcript_17650/g.29821  ORF Transcript_17650/g.29821 Transcript_17650/m.29821 type:complete len:128 (+) Transcript_17650:194-577(+)